MSSPLRPPTATTSLRVQRLVERAMTYAVEEYDGDLAVARLSWLAHDDQAALDQACDVCLSYTDIDLGIRGWPSGCWPGCCTPTSPLTPRGQPRLSAVSCPNAILGPAFEGG